MAKIMTNEVKTGFIVLLCLGILMVFTVSIGKFDMFDKQYEIKTTFTKVAGIEQDAPVRLSGVDVGKVKNVSLLYKTDGETRVLLTLLLNKGARLREDSQALVTTLGLMGEKYIELTPGSKDQPILKAGSTILGKDPVQMEDMMDMATKIAGEIELTLGDIRSLTQHLDELVVENKPDIHGIVENLKRTTENFEEFSDDIKRNPWKLLVKGKEK